MNEQRSFGQRSVVEEIKELADIVQVIGENVELKKRGASYLGLCPFHGEKTPSFSVNNGKQFFHCFGCGESGDVFAYVQKYHNMDFPEALKYLAEKYQIVLPEKKISREESLKNRKKEALWAIHVKAAEKYRNYLVRAPEAEGARRYLQDRGISSQTIDTFGIGYAPSVEKEGWNFLGRQFNPEEQKAAVEAGLLVAREKGGSYDRFRDRIVFPIYNLGGQICGFGGRIIGKGQPKYLNSPESPVYNKSKLLLGLYQQKAALRRCKIAVLVEGNFDLVALVENGCENVVAPLGTSLTVEQLRLLKRFVQEVVLLFDGDAAGKKAAVRAVPLFLKEQIVGKIALLPQGHDPDSYVREFGLKKLEVLLESAESLPEFVFQCWVDQYGLSLDGKRQILDELTPLVEAASSSLQRGLLIAHFAEKLGMEQDLLHLHLGEKATEVSEREISRQDIADNSSSVFEEMGYEQQPPLDADYDDLPVHTVETENKPLTIAQKQLVCFMILHPEHFKVLDENGIARILEGSLGKSIYLKLGGLISEDEKAEPEELLSVLGHGPERKLVGDILLGASAIAGEEEGSDCQDELAEHVEYLRINKLKQETQKLLLKLKEAQQQGNVELVRSLMSQNIELARSLHDKR